MLNFFIFFLFNILYTTISVHAKDISSSYTADIGLLGKITTEISIAEAPNQTKIAEIFFNYEVPIITNTINTKYFKCSTIFDLNTQFNSPIKHDCGWGDKKEQKILIEYKNGLATKLDINGTEFEDGFNFSVLNKSKDFLSATLNLFDKVQQSLFIEDMQIVTNNGVNLYQCDYINNNKKNISCFCRTILITPSRDIASKDCGSIHMKFDEKFFPKEIKWQSSNYERIIHRN